MKRPIIFPYNIGSVGAHELAKALDTICVYPNRSYRPKPNHLIVCWGGGQLPKWWPRSVEFEMNNVLNNPRFIRPAINKLATLEILQNSNVGIPEWTTSKQVAAGWHKKDGIVVARKSLSASEGRGIVVSKPGEPVADANLYTRHLRHKREFRVHVIRGSVVDVSEKRRRSDFEGEPNPLIRNHRFGWVFCHDNVQCPPAVTREAIKAIAAMHLDFGAVDIGFREKEQLAFVFEINTAPGIEGQTVGHYAEAIRQLCK